MTSHHERWLITGAGGQFGSVLVRELVRGGVLALGIISPHGPAPFEGTVVRCDLKDHDAVARLVRANRPTHVVHAAAITHIEQAHDDPELARLTNVDATERLVEMAAEFSARFVSISTDLVFDGSSPPYNESSEARPLSVYGRTKLDGEAFVHSYERGVVVRLPLMYGLPAVDRPTTFQAQLRSIQARAALRLFKDEFRTPISLTDAARACVLVARSGVTKGVHVGGPERLSRLDMGRAVARAIGLGDASIVPISQADATFPEPRPRDVSLDSALFQRHFGKPPGRPMTEALKEELSALGERV
jgi:dTDP-4-dehydrorhamnose reductase